MGECISQMIYLNDFDKILVINVKIIDQFNKLHVIENIQLNKTINPEYINFYFTNDSVNNITY